MDMSNYNTHVSKKFQPGTPVILHKADHKGNVRRLGRALIVKQQANGTFEVNVPGARAGQPARYPQVVCSLHSLPNHPMPHAIYALPAASTPLPEDLQALSSEMML